MKLNNLLNHHCEGYLDETKKQSFTIKTVLKCVINLANSDVNNSFCQNAQHTRDIAYLTSLFANYFCLERLASGQDIPVLNQSLLYDFDSLIVGLGSRANPNAKAFFRSFKRGFDNFLDPNLFTTQGFSTVISCVMRSYETLIKNYVTDSYKRRTIRYFRTCLLVQNGVYHINCTLSTAKALASLIYDQIDSDTNMSFTKSLGPTD
ncbi:hypothetical protein K501DRAFT_179851 [Backusella circina FSU 941]|nr:hypothetical protein K501DRAFT_179851 [Backusella circina FSU 941]